MKTILWDFDGVILDSMTIRTEGFRQIFNGFDKNLVEKLVAFHLENGGLSRYVKIRYFFENILNESIEDAMVLKYAEDFSLIMRKALTDKNGLIKQAINFIRQKKDQYNFHIVSGSDQEELRYLCGALGISNLFISIFGSPTPKSVLVENILKEHQYSKNEVCLIGDSKNDYEAARINDIAFYAFNNVALKDDNHNYIENFQNFDY